MPHDGFDFVLPSLGQRFETVLLVIGDRLDGPSVQTDRPINPTGCRLVEIIGRKYGMIEDYLDARECVKSGE